MRGTTKYADVMILRSGEMEVSQKVKNNKEVSVLTGSLALVASPLFVPKVRRKIKSGAHHSVSFLKKHKK